MTGEYTSHLLKLQNHSDVTTVEDIFSDKGMLIAKSGTKLNEKNYNAILKFKLTKPIEDSIALSNQLNAKSIYNAVMQILIVDPWLKAINSQLGNISVLQKCCLRLQKYPLLLQKLTVMSVTLLKTFDQAIFSAYLAYVCLLNDKAPQTKIEEGFLAGISRDIGYLHIDHHLLTKEEELSSEEWKALEAHPAISFAILKRINHFPPYVARAVLEHHENIDGSGYPKHKTAPELSSLGQLINLIDNVIGLYNKKFKPQKRTLRCVGNIIQVNMHAYAPDAISLIMRLLKQLPEFTGVEKPSPANIRDMVQFTQQNQLYIMRLTGIIREMSQHIGYSHTEKEVIGLQGEAQKILRIINTTGVDNTTYYDWLHELEGTVADANYLEIEDTKILLEEIVYQLQRYIRKANIFSTRFKNHTVTPIINEWLDELHHMPRPVEPSNLAS